MKLGKLKFLRLTIEIIILLLITASFFSVLPDSYHSLPTQTQFLPALISFLSEGLLPSLIIVALLLVITVVFGRVYCSFLCPLGGLQDLLIRIRRFKLGGLIKKKKYSYHPAFKKLRITILVLSVVSLASGGLYFLGSLDPYSIFGKFIFYIVKPALVFFNNSGQTIFEKFDINTVTAMTYPPVKAAAVIPFLIIFGMIVILSLKRGRLYCNTVCPVGTFLGIFSKRSFLKIQLNNSKCDSCRICERSCKAECIDSVNKFVDNSSCVKCFNCLKACKKNAVVYIPTKVFSASSDNLKLGKDFSRREAIYSASGVLAFLGTNLLLGTKKKSMLDNIPPTPPGSIKLQSFKLKCSSCYLCVSKCPTGVLQPSSFQFGIEGAFIPYMDFDSGYCDHECRECLEVCPTNAIMPYILEQKQRIQIGKVKFTKELCDVYKSNTNCGACAEMCPTDALSLVPFKDDLEIPNVKIDTCIGCGACQYVCPAQPQKAMIVKAEPVHKEITLLKSVSTEKKTDG